MNSASVDQSGAKRKTPTLRGLGKDKIVIHGDLTEPTFGDEPVEEMLTNWEKTSELN